MLFLFVFMFFLFFCFFVGMVYSYVYSEQKYGKSEENLRGEAEEVF